MAIDALCLSPCVNSLQAYDALQLSMVMIAMEFDLDKTIATSSCKRLMNLDYASANVPSHTYVEKEIFNEGFVDM
jgi:hypothetical protein